jgi:hypothetical protein
MLEAARYAGELALPAHASPALEALARAFR